MARHYFQHRGQRLRILLLYRIVPHNGHAGVKFSTVWVVFANFGRALTTTLEFYTSHASYMALLSNKLSSMDPDVDSQSALEYALIALLNFTLLAS